MGRTLYEVKHKTAKIKWGLFKEENKEIYEQLLLGEGWPLDEEENEDEYGLIGNEDACTFELINKEKSLEAIKKRRYKESFYNFVKSLREDTTYCFI